MCIRDSLKAYLQKTTFALQASAGVLYEN
jgi:hypothetical protein